MTIAETILGLKWKDYLAQYQGPLNYERSILLALEFPSSRLLIINDILQELKKGYNPIKYKNFCENKISQNILPPSFEIDVYHKIVHRCELRKRQFLEDLDNYKSVLSRDSMKKLYSDLGNHYIDSGDFFDANEAFSSAENYCYTENDHFMIFLNQIRNRIYSFDWNNLLLLCKNEGLKFKCGDEYKLGIINCCFGLSYLGLKNYSAAAYRFLECMSVIEESFKEFLLPVDVAGIALFCALCSFSHVEFKKNIINNTHFACFKEKIPEMNAVVESYLNRDYKKLMEKVKNFMPVLRVNPLLMFSVTQHPFSNPSSSPSFSSPPSPNSLSYTITHPIPPLIPILLPSLSILSSLLSSVRQGMLLSYVKPYCMMDVEVVVRDVGDIYFEEMVGGDLSCFGCEEEENKKITKEEMIERCFIDLIIEGKVKGKVDPVNHHLSITNPNPCDSVGAVLELLDGIITNLHSILLTYNIKQRRHH